MKIWKVEIIEDFFDTCDVILSSERKLEEFFFDYNKAEERKEELLKTVKKTEGVSSALVGFLYPVEVK